MRRDVYQRAKRPAYGVTIANCLKYANTYLSMTRPISLNRYGQLRAVPFRRVWFSSPLCARSGRSSRCRYPIRIRDEILPGSQLLTFEARQPVVCFDQINAIFDPKPNFPRVCLTPYFVPDNTRPNMFGMSLCSMPFPLSFTVILKYDFFSSPFVEFPRPPPFFPLFAFAAAAFSSCISTFASLSPTVSLSPFPSQNRRIKYRLSSRARPIQSSSRTASASPLPLTRPLAAEPRCAPPRLTRFSMNSLNVVYNDFPAFSNPAMPLLSWKKFRR